MGQFKPQRKVFYLLLLCALAVAGGNLAKAADDNLRVRFTTTMTGSSYSPKHIHVVWLATTGESFVSTAGTNLSSNKRAVWAKDRKDSLNAWWTSARQGDIDARTGATQSGSQSYDFNWNFRRLNGTEIADGTYRLYFELTSDDDGSPRKFTYFTITKGASSWSIGPITQDGYNNVSLDFIPGIIPAPVVTNSPVTNKTSDSATLNGNVTVDSDVTIYWGDEDGGETPGNWAYHVDLVGVAAGNFSTDISSLLPVKTYYFRCYADNETGSEGGTDWADSTSSFMTEPATPDIYLSEESLDFGEVAVGSYADLTFDIQNDGFGDDLIVGSLEVTGLSKSAFSIISPPALPFNIAPGAPSQTVTVRFAPTVYAESYASVSIGNDDPDLTVADVSLTGTGTMDAEVSLSVLSGVGGICNAVVPVGSNLLVAQGAMLTILDASTPSALELVGQVRLADIIQDITVVGDTAYAAIGASGIQVVDITTLSAPIALAVFDTQGHSYEVASAGTTLCVADGANGLLIYDISTPSAPSLQQIQPMNGSATAVTISATTAFVLDDRSGLRIIDLTSPSGLTAHWKLDDNTLDSVNSHDGTVYGDPTFSVGKIGGAMAFSGNDYVTADSISTDIAGGDFTLTAWIKSDSTVAQEFFAAFNDAAGGNRLLIGHNAGTSNLVVYDGSFQDSGTVVFDGEWHHIAIVLDDAANTMTQYVDGENVYSSSAATTIAADDSFSLGQEYDGLVTGDFYNGLLDEVRIYSHALSANDIQTLYGASAEAWDELELGQAIAVSGTTAYVTDQLGNFFVVDITDPAAMSLLGETRVSGGNGTSIAISGSYAFVTNASGVEVFDISVPSDPNSKGIYSSTQASDIAIDGSTAYLAETGFGLRALDLTSPTSPVSLGDFSFQTMPKAVAAGTSAAIIADDTDGMQVVGLTDPADPDAISSTSTGALGYAQDVAMNGSLAYLANGLLGLQIVDLADPDVPVLLGSYPTLGALSFASSVAVSGTTAMIADGRIAYVIDVSNSSSPSLDGQWISAGWAGGVAIDGAYGYVANGAMGIEVLNIGDATSAGSLELPGVAYDIAVSGGIAYVAAGSAGLQIIDVSTPASPSVIASFDTPGMALGVTLVGSRVCVADNYSVAVIDVSNPATPYLYALSDIPVNSLGTDVVNSRLIVADGNAGIAILRAHLQPNIPLGDFNGNGTFELGDLLMLAGEWMEIETMLDVLATNITDDTTVNLEDYAFMARNWIIIPELLAIDPATGVTASSEIPGYDRTDDHIVDGSGLTASQHSSVPDGNMWLSSGIVLGGEDTDPSVTFDLGAVYTISRFHIWNYNQPGYTARSINDVSVEYGTTAALGSTVAEITNFARATGADGYTGEEFDTFTPFRARYIKFDINSNYGDVNLFYGLSEVQFYGWISP